MNPTRTQTQAVKSFSCLGADCPDTCCQGWGMQVTEQTVTQYQQHAPELLDSVVVEASGFVMRRDAATDVCVKFEGGWCAIQRDYGDTFLGDACHFFPRITRSLGPLLITTATLSCPETARLMLYTEDGLSLSERTEVRVPYSLRDYLPAGMDENDALAIHEAFIEMAGDGSASAARNLMRMSAVARAIEMQPVTAWRDAVPFYTSTADSRIPAAEAAATDIFNMTHALHGLVMASQSRRARLLEIIEAMADALGMTFQASGGLVLADDANARALRMMAVMRAQAETLQPVLRRWVQAQISQAFFPFSGFGQTLTERITIIGVRYATMRLALATLSEAPEEKEVIRIIQTLSRFSDHLADPTLSLQIYNETGWVREPRLRAIVGE
jgi:lysine-N-methylase